MENILKDLQCKPTLLREIIFLAVNINSVSCECGYISPLPEMWQPNTSTLF